MRSASTVRRFRIFVLVGGIAGWIFLSCYKGNGLSPLVSDSGGATTGIKGKIVFTGDWPDSTKEVRVAVLKNYPNRLTNSDSLMAFVLLNLVAFSDTLPRFASACDYELALPVGTYGWVLVAWFPNIPQYIFGVKELGAYYRIGGMQKTPSPVHVIPGVMMEGINISAELDNIKRPLPFFKPLKIRIKE